ncbi:B- and T-lymphocyte attenuator isoform X2 [Kryptolebias marmoratus]|uniref:B- and T-lymphocyte attenuator isoform X2 n=1 Tax=Kryptolebias marmoratus TaxID=37003 RepID=UPI0018ACA986|nr:B- and T-lymphocyte attenuator isoform X2 [Kryptolebias marmoratus]
MLGRMDTLSYLMVVFCFTFFIGEGEALPSSCDITLKVKRGTTLEATKGQSLTVSCPVGHCGESLNVTWCKLLGKSNCEVVSSTKKVEINQEHVNDELISYLRFKEVSINDGGQYRCNLIRQSSQLVSHSINISVSGTNKEVQNSVTSTALPSSCDITLKRGATWRVTKGQNLTVSCHVGHCGESLNVTWCKRLGESNCEVISTTQNVEINQEHVNDELISYLSFKEVSFNDGGQYRCNLIRQSSQLVSHSINISVSGGHFLLFKNKNEYFSECPNFNCCSLFPKGINNEVQKSVNSTVESVGDGDDTSHRWQVFVSVSVSFASVVVILTIIDPLNSHGPKTDTKRADGLVESRATYALITHRHPIISAKLQKMTQDDKNSLCTTVIYSKQFYYPT